jgi:4-amino-4-deoxy-L-arabinose transferase-like glycosyltransferase
LLIVGVEAVVVLGALGLSSYPIWGGDSREYERYASNLVSHGAFSNALSAPFLPSVFRVPGYPLFLAFFRLLAPDSLLLVRIAQFILLWLTALLTYRVALFVSSRRTALISAVVCATFLPLLTYAVQQETEVLATFLVVAVVLLVFRARAGGTGRSATLARFAAVGVVAGLLSLVRPEDALLVVPITVGLFISDRDIGAARWQNLGALLAAFAVTMAPWTIRNAVVAHRFLPLGADSGQTLYISAQQYAGRISYAAPHQILRYGPSGRTYKTYGITDQITGHGSPYAGPLGGVRVELADDSALRSAAWRVFRRLSVAQIIRSLPSRIAHLWGTADAPPPRQSFSVIAHRLALVQWALVIALAALGVLLCAMNRRIRDMWPLVVLPVYTTVVHLVFNVEARFTIPDRPLLIIFAGVALGWCYERAVLRFSLRSFPSPVSSSRADRG